MSLFSFDLTRRDGNPPLVPRGSPSRGDDGNDDDGDGGAPIMIGGLGKGMGDFIPSLIFAILYILLLFLILLALIFLRAPRHSPRTFSDPPPQQTSLDLKTRSNPNTEIERGLHHDGVEPHEMEVSKLRYHDQPALPPRSEAPTILPDDQSHFPSNTKGLPTHPTDLRRSSSLTRFFSLIISIFLFPPLSTPLNSHSTYFLYPHALIFVAIFRIPYFVLRLIQSLETIPSSPNFPSSSIPIALSSPALITFSQLSLMIGYLIPLDFACIWFMRRVWGVIYPVKVKMKQAKKRGRRGRGKADLAETEEHEQTVEKNWTCKFPFSMPIPFRKATLVTKTPPSSDRTDIKSSTVSDTEMENQSTRSMKPTFPTTPDEGKLLQTSPTSYPQQEPGITTLQQQQSSSHSQAYISAYRQSLRTNFAWRFGFETYSRWGALWLCGGGLGAWAAGIWWDGNGEGRLGKRGTVSGLRQICTAFPVEVAAIILEECLEAVLRRRKQRRVKEKEMRESMGQDSIRETEDRKKPSVEQITQANTVNKNELERDGDGVRQEDKRDERSTCDMDRDGVQGAKFPVTSDTFSPGSTSTPSTSPHAIPPTTDVASSGGSSTSFTSQNNPFHATPEVPSSVKPTSPRRVSPLIVTTQHGSAKQRTFSSSSLSPDPSGRSSEPNARGEVVEMASTIARTPTAMHSPLLPSYPLRSISLPSYRSRSDSYAYDHYSSFDLGTHNPSIPILEEEGTRCSKGKEKEDGRRGSEGSSIMENNRKSFARVYPSYPVSWISEAAVSFEMDHDQTSSRKNPSNGDSLIHNDIDNVNKSKEKDEGGSKPKSCLGHWFQKVKQSLKEKEETDLSALDEKEGWILVMLGLSLFIASTYLGAISGAVVPHSTPPSDDSPNSPVPVPPLSAYYISPSQTALFYLFFILPEFVAVSGIVGWGVWGRWTNGRTLQ